MERNALIYSASECTVIIHSRFKQGGTWIGATQAIRKRICPLAVKDDGGEAAKAFIALGALPLGSVEGLEKVLVQNPAHRGLFGIG